MRDRFAERVAAWRVDVERVAETATGMLGFGTRDGQPVVIKVVDRRSDEWRAGEWLDALSGKREAGSGKREAGSGKREAGRG